MPLQQAKSPIHLDLIFVCRKAAAAVSSKQETDPLPTAVYRASAQAAALAEAGIAVSLSDAKVILMGQLLCQAHQKRCLDDEETFLAQREKDIDEYVKQVLAERGEVLYKAPSTEQLVLFEEMAEYLADNRRPAQA